MKNHSWKLRALSLAMCAAMGLSPIGEAGAAMAEEASAKSSQVHVYAPTGDDPTTENINESPDKPSDKYKLSADGTEIPVVKYDRRDSRFDVARFASSTRTPEFQVTLPNQEINSVTVYPERYYPKESLKISEDKHTLTFTMSQAANLNYAIVMVNGNAGNRAGQPNLAIINDPLETNVPDINGENVLNFKTFAAQYLKDHPNETEQKPEQAGTVTFKLAEGTADEKEYTFSHGSGQLVDPSTMNVRYPDQRKMSADDVSYAFQAALDEIYSNAKLDTLYFPNGTYTYAGLDVRNRRGKNVTIYLEEGALLKNRMQSCAEAMEPAIGIWDSEDITIAGRGMFDGNGVDNSYNQSGKKSGDRGDAYMSCHQAGVTVVRSSNITFQDTYMRNAKQWNWEAHNGKHIRLNNIKGLTPYAIPWGDGTDMAGSQDLQINGAFTLGNDDCFASGHYNPSRWFAPEKKDLYSKEFGLSSFKPEDNDPNDEKFQKFSNAVAGYVKYNGDNDRWDVEDSFGIVVKNTLQWSDLANGIRIGHEAHGHQLRDYTFENFNVLGFPGFGITVQNGTDIYPRYETLKFINCSFDTSRTGTNFSINGGDGSQQTAMGKGSDLNGDTDGYTGATITKTPIESVEMKGCWFSNASAACSVSNTKNLTIEDLYIGGKKITSSSDFSLSLQNVENFTKDYADNSAPSFTSPQEGSFAVADGETLEFDVKAADPDGDTVSIRAEGLPEGAAFDAPSGKFVWQVPEGAVGKTYQMTFTASDSYTETAKTIEVKVTSSQVEIQSLPAAEDASLHTWKGEKNQIKNLDYVRTRRPADLSTSLEQYGYIGEKGIGTDTNDGTDQKMALLKFDVSGLAGKLDSITAAELSLTYMGRRESSHDGMDTIRAAVIPDSEWNEKEVTWNNHPAFEVAENGYRESSPFSTSGTKNVLVAQDDKYNNNQAVDGRKISIDITDFIKNITEGQKYLTLAVNETKGYELIFMGKTGAQNNSNADEGMAPAILLSVTSAPSVTGPASMELTDGYAAASTEGFLIKGARPVTVAIKSGNEKITWNDSKKCLDIAPGLPEGSYPVQLEFSNEIGKQDFTFTLTVQKKSIAEKPITAIKLAEASKTLNEGGSFQIQASVEPEDTTDSKELKYTSLNEEAATVSETGLVQAVKAGTAQIRVASAAREDIFAIVNVTVKKAETPKPVDKTKLKAAVTKAQKKNLSAYTKASVKAFQKALSSAKTALSNQKATQAQVNAALKALNKADAGLVRKVPAKGTTFKSGSLQYKVTKSDAKKGTVMAVKLVSKGKKLVIPSTVKKDGYTFKVTAVNKSLSYKNKKLQEVVLGANVAGIGAKSFSQCTKLAKITFQGKKAPKVGSKAFTGIKKKCKIIVPKKMAQKEWKLLKKRMASAGKTVVYQKK